LRSIIGLETEYGTLLNREPGSVRDLFRQEEIFQRLRDHIFHTRRLGVIDQHQRAYDEPVGNGGFLKNGGRLYVDMGHLEYASPEALDLLDLVLVDRAGDQILQDAINELGLTSEISLIKNNIDHQTLATFGSHENYLVSRQFPFTEKGMEPLVAFLVTRQIFTGAGRVGSANLNESIITFPPTDKVVTFQLSQRADYVVNKFYQWVQMNRSIVNTRDEPLADPALFRRMHLLMGDSNMSQFATAMKFGTTRLALSLIEDGFAPAVGIIDPVRANHAISHDISMGWRVMDNDGQMLTATDLQWMFFEAADRNYRGRDEETDWVLSEWAELLSDLGKKDPSKVADRVDWAAKFILLNQFREEEGLEWGDPWLESLDLEYHNIHPEKGLFRILEQEGRHRRLISDRQIADGVSRPPDFTRACGRSMAVNHILEENDLSYIIQWFGIQVNEGEVLYMLDPLKTYHCEGDQYFSDPPDVEGRSFEA